MTYLLASVGVLVGRVSIGTLPGMTHAPARLRAIFDEHIATLQRSRDELLPLVAELGAELCEALASDRKLVVFGNGGSAADAQHFAAELTGHFKAERGPLPAIALTVDTSALTAIANDYGYADVFARQATALCRPGDVVVAISTSGQVGERDPGRGGCLCSRGAHVGLFGRHRWPAPGSAWTAASSCPRPRRRASRKSTSPSSTPCVPSSTTSSRPARSEG